MRECRKNSNGERNKEKDTDRVKGAERCMKQHSKFKT